MDKKKIQIFADTVREKLYDEITKQATTYKIAAEMVAPVDQRFEDSIVIQGKVFNKRIEKQRDRLIKEIEEKGYVQVIDEVTYTWFNRFLALKYMEFHEYIPVRVVSSKDSGKIEPDIIGEALHLDFLDVDRETVLSLKSRNDIEGLYKYLVLQLCHYLHSIMPFLFETIGDYTELLFPSRLLHTDSILKDLNTIINDEDWQEVEIIGWLYQSYIAKEKQKLIESKKKYTEKQIDKVTQLFTPKWIVKYMVQNSLGRYWLEAHPYSEIEKTFDFYLKSRDPENEKKLEGFINKNVEVEKIKLIDPAMGSGHILVYAFEVFYQIYKSQGYLESEIPVLILKNNLFGLDIDDRAGQLAQFALLMKAREKDNKLFSKEIIINAHSIQESNIITDDVIRIFAGQDFDKVKLFFDQFIDAKTYGSILKIQGYDKEYYNTKFEQFKKSGKLAVHSYTNLIKSILNQAEILTQEYDVAVANPPYLNSKRMPENLKGFVKNNYPQTKSDLYAIFIEIMLKITKKNGQIGLVTPYVWMFIKTYQWLREYIVKEKNISSLIQLEYNAFPVACVPVCTFTLRNTKTNASGEYIKLSDFKGSENQPIKTLEAIKNPEASYRHTEKSQKFAKIPGSPIAYWISPRIRELFEDALSVTLVSVVSSSQNKTANNNKYLKFNWEVEKKKVGVKQRWVSYAKGGNFRRWYGNLDFIVDWSEDAQLFYKNNLTSNLIEEKVRFKEGISYTDLTTSFFNCRYLAKDSLFDISGPSIIIENKENRNYILSLFNSKLAQRFFSLLNPTFHTTIGDIKNFPVIFTSHNKIKQKIDQLTQECIDISKEEWDSRETSWDFKQNELFKRKDESNRLEIAFKNYCKYWEEQFFKLHKNEGELNQLFIDIYDLNDELDNKVPLKEITILGDESEIKENKLKFKKEVIVKQFLSYIVGCIFGRYSPDKEGLILANQGDTLNEFNLDSKFKPDEDNIIPITDKDYFPDDIVGKVKEFIKTTFGEETLSENLQFIADSLHTRGKGSAEETIRHYFLTQFYKDHCKMYKKRPIYWMFTSGKNKSFNALIYMHRYNKELLAKLRIDYLHEYQAKLEARKQSLPLNSDDIKIRSQAEKERADINKKLDETRSYDEYLQNLANKFIDIDLDDGVNENYKKFTPLLEKIL
jgi:hypothetical protein